MSNVQIRTWEEFKDSQLLWWVNRSLHLFGWAIALKQNEDGKLEAFPAKVKFRGFSLEREDEGFIKLTNYLADNIQTLKDDTIGK